MTQTDVDFESNPHLSQKDAPDLSAKTFSSLKKFETVRSNHYNNEIKNINAHMISYHQFFSSTILNIHYLISFIDTKVAADLAYADSLVNLQKRAEAEVLTSSMKRAASSTSTTSATGAVTGTTSSIAATTTAAAMGSGPSWANIGSHTKLSTANNGKQAQFTRSSSQSPKIQENSDEEESYSSGRSHIHAHAHQPHSMDFEKLKDITSHIAQDRFSDRYQDYSPDFRSKTSTSISNNNDDDNNNNNNNMISTISSSISFNSKSSFSQAQPYTGKASSTAFLNFTRSGSSSSSSFSKSQQTSATSQKRTTIVLESCYDLFHSVADRYYALAQEVKQRVIKEKLSDILRKIEQMLVLLNAYAVFYDRELNKMQAHVHQTWIKLAAVYEACRASNALVGGASGTGGGEGGVGVGTTGAMAASASFSKKKEQRDKVKDLWIFDMQYRVAVQAQRDFMKQAIEFIVNLRYDAAELESERRKIAAGAIRLFLKLCHDYTIDLSPIDEPVLTALSKVDVAPQAIRRDFNVQVKQSILVMAENQITENIKANNFLPRANLSHENKAGQQQKEQQQQQNSPQTTNQQRLSYEIEIDDEHFDEHLSDRDLATEYPFKIQLFEQELENPFENEFFRKAFMINHKKSSDSYWKPYVGVFTSNRALHLFAAPGDATVNSDPFQIFQTLKSKPPKMSLDLKRGRSGIDMELLSSLVQSQKLNPDQGHPVPSDPVSEDGLIKPYASLDLRYCSATLLMDITSGSFIITERYKKGGFTSLMKAEGTRSFHFQAKSKEDMHMLLSDLDIQMSD